MTRYREGVRAMRLLAELRLRRLLNMAARPRGRQDRSASNGGATSTRQPSFLARGGVGGIVMLWMPALAAYSLGDNIRHFLLALTCHGDALCAPGPAAHAVALVGHASSSGLGDAAMRGMTLLTSLLWLISLLYPFSLSVRSGPEWDFEWIATLPVPRGTLLCAHIVERGIVNPIAWIALLTPGTIVAWHAGSGWFAPVCAILTTVPLLLSVSSIWTVLDLGLHIALAPSALRNLQALLGLALAPAIFLLAYLGTPKGGNIAAMLAGHMPAWSI